jgi:hypothetical protein
MGRERPRLQFASAAPSRSAGSLTPHRSVSVLCWGARWMVAEMRLNTLPFSLENTGRKTILNVASESIEFLDQIRAAFAVAPVLNFPGALGRVKASFADAHRLRGLDPPGALPSDWQLPERRRNPPDNPRQICRRFFAGSARLQSCVLTNSLSNPHDRSTMLFSLV